MKIKTKKGNVAVIAIIIVIVAITAGMVGYLFAKRSKPVQQSTANQSVETQKQLETVIGSQQEVQIDVNPDDVSSEKKNDDVLPCGEDTQCGSKCSYGESVYTTKMFANLCWMTKNINTKTTDRYCFDNDPKNCEIYGGLYLWADAMGLSKKCNTKYCDSVNNSQGICPNGWHVSMNDEWKRLTNVFSYERLVNDAEVAFGKTLTGKRHYEGPDTSNDGSIWVGSFFDLDYGGYYWTPSQVGSNGALSWNFNSYDQTVQSYGTINKGVGFSVRCVKNEENTDYDTALNLQHDFPCTESDDGIDYYKKGKAVGIYDGAWTENGNGVVIGKKQMNNSGMKSTVYYDHCQSKTELNEAYCEDGKLEAIGFSCPNGCNDGTCEE